MVAGAGVRVDCLKPHQAAAAVARGALVHLECPVLSGLLVAIPEAAYLLVLLVPVM